MTTFKRFAHSLALTLIIPLAFAVAQTPSVSTVNVTPDEQKVSVSSVGDVLDLRVSVSDESGDIVFESGPVAGDKLDWTMRDAQGQRVPAGTYTLSVTYRTSNGKLKRRVEQVLVTEEVTGTTSAAAEDTTPQAVGTITGQGTTGRISKFTGTNSIGNSVLTESAGRIGLGTTAPAQSLHVLGASSRLRLQSSGSASLTTTEYVTNNRVWQAGAGGSTAAAGVASKFFVFDQTANQYRLVIDTAGNFGVGTTAPASRLTVNGMIQIVGPTTNGIKFADGSIQTKAIAGTINGTGAANRLAKFTGPNSFGNSSVTEVSGKIGIGVTNPTAKLDVAGSIKVTGSIGVTAASSDGLDVSTTASDGYGVYGTSSSGIGVRGTGNIRAGVLGTTTDSNGSGVEGNASGSNAAGVLGLNSSGPGVWGRGTDGGTGVYGQSSGYAVYGASTGGFGVYGTSSNGGVVGVGYVGVQGNANGTTDSQGVRGDNGGSNTVGYAGLFNGRVSIFGNLNVYGTLAKSAGAFRIDHPLDPANKYLYHSFVESPDMMNIYNGNVTTDARGEATVELPAYFEALNRDFRYQLTVIGPVFAQAIVSREVKGNRFQIRTDRPNVKVSWQVTGVRHDPYAEAHRITVEEDKAGADQGRYQYPELYGQPKEKTLESVRPQGVKSPGHARH